MSDDAIRDAARREMEGAVMDMAAKESMATGITLKVEELQVKNQDAIILSFSHVSLHFQTVG
jgi:membrane protein required for beta-lactamase induction